MREGRGIPDSYGSQTPDGQEWGSRSLVKQRLVLLLLEGSWQPVYKLGKLFPMFSCAQFLFVSILVGPPRGTVCVLYWLL